MVNRIQWRAAAQYKFQNPLGRLADAQGLTRMQLATALNVSGPALPAYVAPLDHHQFRMPPEAVMKRIFIWSGGIITPNSFRPLLSWQADLEKVHTAMAASGRRSASLTAREVWS